MQEALNASLGNLDEDHLEEMLDVADTVARYVPIIILFLLKMMFYIAKGHFLSDHFSIVTRNI